MLLILAFRITSWCVEAINYNIISDVALVEGYNVTSVIHPYWRLAYRERQISCTGERNAVI